MENMTRKVEQMIRRNAKRKLWRRAVSIPAAIVVFVTTYALILPAIAMERDTFCGQEEHRHDESCYVDQLICGYEEGQWVTGPTRVWELDCHALDSVHQHTDACYDDQGNLICRYADYLAHEHNADCYDANGALICPLPENKVHAHTAECYVQEQVLSCGQEESAGHTHTAECYTVTETRTLTCGQEEYPGHTHTAECYNTYNNTYLACGQEEYAGHTHTESCYAPVYAEDGTTVVGMELVCGQEESAGHTHTDACYATETISELICGQEEYPGHTHTDACYTVTQEQTLTCGQEEHPGHTHTDACYTTENRLVCDKPEIILHTHYNDNSDNDCYDEYGNLICTQLEVNEHVHSEACFAEREVAPAQEHHHTDVCYQHTLICGMEEHVHTLLCYADPNATPVPSVEETAAPAPDQIQPGTEPTPVGEAEPSVSKGPVFLFDPNAAEDEAAAPTEDIEPSVSVEPTEVVEPSVSVEPTEEVEPSVSVEPTEEIEPSVSMEPAEEIEPSVSVEPTEEIEPSEDVEPTEDAEPSESPEPTATLKPVGGMADDGPSFDGAMTPTPKPTATTEPTATPEPELVCGLEEHTHDGDKCYNMMGELTCELAEHTHTEDCWATPVPSEDVEPSESPEPTATTEPTATPEPELVCELEEHTHDEDCYDEDGELICELEEHEHTDECYAIPETAEPTATPEPELICGLEEHTHDEDCYDEDGELICELEEHTHTEDCYATPIRTTATPEPTAEPTATPAPTPVPTVEVTMLICGQEEHEHTAECMLDGEYICGKNIHTHTDDCYTTVLMELLCGQTAHEHNEECYDEAGELICGLEEHTHTEGCLGDIVQPLDDYGIMTMDLPEGDPEMGEAVAFEETDPNGGVRKLDEFITDVDNSGITYDPLTGEWSTQLTMDFRINKEDFAEGYEFDYEFRDGVFVPDMLLSENAGTFKDKNGRFDYWFTKDANGKYHLHVKFDEKEVQKLGDYVNCWISFKASGGTTTTDQNFDVHFSDSVHMTVEPDEIETKSDLSTRKEGVYDPQSNKLVYKVYVESNRGTDGKDITVDDSFVNLDNIKDLLKSGDPNITVQREYFRNSWDGGMGDPELLSPDQYQKNSTEDGHFTLTLPELEVGEVDGERLSQRYVITYEYELNDVSEGTSSWVNNKVTAKTEDHTSGDNAGVTVERSTLDKSARQDGEDIVWTIVVNKTGLDLTDYKLSDDFFNQNTKGFTISPADEHYHWEDDVLVFDAVDDGPNTQTYTITYKTSASDYYGKTVTNHAHLEGGPDGEPDYNDDAGITPQEPVEVVPTPYAEKSYSDLTSVPGGMEVTWTVSLQVPAEGFRKGAKFEDEIGTSDKTSYMTYDQFMFVVSELYRVGLLEKAGPITYKCINFIEGHFANGANNTGTYDYKTGEFGGEHKLQDNCVIQYFSFELLDDVPYSDLASHLDENGKLTFSYTTFVSETVKQDNTIKNRFNNAESSFNYKEDSVNKTDGNGTSDASFEVRDDGTLVWKVAIQVGNVDHDQLVVKDDLPDGVQLEKVEYSYNNYVGEAGVNRNGISATPDEKGNLEFTIYDDSIVADNWLDKFVPYENLKDGRYNRETGESTITICGDDALANGYITLTYYCKITDENVLTSLRDGTYDLQKYTNSVDVSFDGKHEQDTDTQTVTGKGTKEEETYKDVVVKEGEYRKVDNTFKYSLDINPEGLLLLEGKADYLQLEDVLTYKKQCKLENYILSGYISDVYSKEYQANFDGPYYDQIFELDVNSVKLYNAKTNDEITNWQWQIERRETENGESQQVIKALVPDGVPLRMEYSYVARADNVYYYIVNYWDANKPSGKMMVSQDVMDENGQGDYVDKVPKVSASNTATIEGKWDDKDEGTTEWEDAYTDAGSSTNGYSLYKVDSKSNTKRLAGAEFTIYEYNPDGVDINKGAFTTGMDGVIHIGAENKKDVITFKVITKDANGNDHSEAVELQQGVLYYFQETKAPSGYQTQTPNPRYWFWYGDDTTDISGIPLAAGETIYDLRTNANHVQFIPNEETEEYTLPATGGVGSLVYTLGGLAMLSLAGALVCDQRRRRTSKGGGAD